MRRRKKIRKDEIQVENTKRETRKREREKILKRIKKKKKGGRVFN